MFFRQVSFIFLIFFFTTDLCAIEELSLKKTPLTLKVGTWQFKEQHGTYKVSHDISNICTKSYLKDQSSIHFKDCPYRISIEKKEARYRFKLHSPPTKKKNDQVMMTFHFKKNKKHRYYGGGTQYSYLNLNGKKTPFLTQEQGNGRGVQPLSFFQSLVMPGISGTPSTTYASAPLIYNSEREAMVFDQKEFGELDLMGERFDVSFLADEIDLFYYKADSWSKLTELVTRHTGRMRALPDWILEGAIIGTMGGSKLIAAQLDKLRKANTALAGVWIQDWVGQRETFIGPRLIWDWVLDKETYPQFNFPIPTLGYFNPFLSPLPKGQTHRRKKSMFLEAKKKNYLVKINGDLYSSKQGGFEGHLVDLFNPKAYQWLKTKMKKAILLHSFKGWMADFSETYPIKKNAFNHHLYIEKWVQLNRDLVDEISPTELTFFNRASTLSTPGKSTLFWLGDQTSTWDKNDGLHSSLIGLLSSGLSGAAFNHSDIGGYVSLRFRPFINIVRTEELFLRWMELNAFSAIFRTHLGLNPKLALQVDHNKKTLDSFSYWSRVFKALSPYKKQLIKLAEKKGTPLIRPLFYHYPNDPIALDCEDQFLLGESLLIAPILRPTRVKRNVYLPKGNWSSLWGQKHFSSQGQYIEVDAPLGRPAVFFKKKLPSKNSG